MEDIEAAPSVVAEPELEAVPLAEPVTGIVLAGGRSRRMGGRDKAWLEVAGRPMIQWVLDALAQVSQYQLVVNRRVGGRMQDLDVPVVQDRFPLRGPLTGLHAGLKAAPTELCLVVACDLPLVQPDLLRFLGLVIGPAHAAVPYVEEGLPPPPGDLAAARQSGLQPLCAAYRRACIGPLEKLLATGNQQAVLLASVVKARIVGPEEWRVVDAAGRSFLNVNNPEDVTEAARLLAGLDG